MSLTPVDESSSEDPVDEEPDQERRSMSGVARAREAVSAAVRSLGQTIRDSLRQTDAESDDRDEGNSGNPLARTGDSAALSPVNHTESGAVRDGTALSATRRLPEAGESGGRTQVESRDDRPELAARWDDDELTLSVPGDPDASITSDVWEDVRR